MNLLLIIILYLLISFLFFSIGRKEGLMIRWSHSNGKERKKYNKKHHIWGFISRFSIGIIIIYLLFFNINMVNFDIFALGSFILVNGWIFYDFLIADIMENHKKPLKKAFSKWGLPKIWLISFILFYFICNFLKLL